MQPLRPSIHVLLLVGFLAAIPAQAQESTVQIKVDASQASTRLILTHSSLEMVSAA